MVKKPAYKQIAKDVVSTCKRKKTSIVKCINSLLSLPEVTQALHGMLHNLEA